MSSNSFGKIFSLTTFGESHGSAIGGVIDGCPAGIAIEIESIQKDLNRRKPGQSKIVTQRKEPNKKYQSKIKGLFTYQRKLQAIPRWFCLW